MTAIDFPDAPTNGQVHDKWTWDGTVWRLTPPASSGGFVGMHEVTASTTGNQSVWNDTGLTFTFTAVAGRRYSVSFCGGVRGSSSSSFSQLGLFRDGVQVQQVAAMTAAVTSFGHFYGRWVSNTIPAGSTTFTVKFQGVGNPVQFNASANTPAQLVVEDIS